MLSDMFEIRTDNAVTKSGGDPVNPHEIQKLHEWGKDDPKNKSLSADESVTVAVMDSGIDQRVVDNHPWFENATVGKREDFTGTGTGNDGIGHGTGVASLISRNVPEVELYSAKIFGNQGKTGFQVTKSAYQWLIENASEIDIVNMSWGASSNVPEINNLHEKLISKDVHDVVAAGNSGSDGGSPATAKKAFSVGATDENGDPVRFSSFNPDRGNPDIAAVGKDVAMAKVPGTSMGYPVGSRWVRSSGTSFSAPIAAAAYVNALYKAKKSWDTSLMNAAPDIPGTEKDGGGILKLKSTLNNETKNTRVEASVHSFNNTDTVYIDASWLPSGSTNAEKIDETKDYVDIRIRK